MRSIIRTILTGILSLGVGQAIGESSASAQGPGPIGSLGGYGGSMTDTGSSMGMSGPIIPYAGKFGGFMPYRVGGSGSLSFQSRGSSPLGSNRTSFSLSPGSGGMSSMPAGIGKGLGTGSQGSMGLGGGMPLMPASRGMGVMPPSFAYPFRQPPSLLLPSSSGSGMSM